MKRLFNLFSCAKIMQSVILPEHARSRNSRVALRSTRSFRAIPMSGSVYDTSNVPTENANIKKLLGRKMRWFIAVLGILILASKVDAQSGPLPDLLSRNQIEAALAELPSGERWIKYLHEDLMPFWETRAALGGDVRGDFPSYRDNRGAMIDWSTPHDELPPEIQGGLHLGLIFPEREYLRTRSRQIFGYCIAFQMTGDAKYLEYAFSGIEANYLRQGRYYDEENGMLFSYYDTKTKTYKPGTSQDWAYGLSGPAYYYYVTKDERVLPLLLQSRKKLEELFYDTNFGMYRWVTERTDDGEPDQREIVSNLDQIYGYMLLVYRSLPEEEQKLWKQQIHNLAVILLKEFQGSQEGFFWGRTEKTSEKHFGAEHTDFGHTTKTYWLIMHIGRQTNDPALEMIGRRGAARMIHMAYDPVEETWNQKMVPDWDERYLKPVRDREWWTLAVMDQTAASLSLRDPDFLKYISRTHRFWFDHMVDHRDKEIWHQIKAEQTKPDQGFPKSHAWKTCFHTTEHALVMYLTSQQLHGKPAVLHFVRPRENFWNTNEYYPYIFEGEVRSDNIAIKSNEFRLPGNTKPRVHVKVSFQHIR